jgi:hypothetical protein
MALSVKILRTGTGASLNKFVVTAGSGDTGKLQIQYNDSDIYNNLSGSISDIESGASNTTITIPLDANNQINKGKYYFNFVASVGSSDTETINFQIDEISPVIASEADVYAPSFRTDDNSGYIVDNGTVTAASRTLIVQYPTGSEQANLTATATDVTSSLYITTSNLWTGAMQTTLAYDVTYTIAATTGFDTYTYQESGAGYDTENIDPDNALCDVYDCIESLRQQVVSAATNRRSNYASLLSNYTYTCSLALQFREAVTCSKTAALDDIIAQIKAITNCQGSSTTNPSTESRKVYGIGGSSESIQDIVGEMFTDAINYGVKATYNDNLATVSLEGNGLFLNVYNNTGSAIVKGKAVYVSGFDSTTGLPEITLADSTSAETSEAIGLVYTDIASATSGKVIVSGWFEEVNTLSYSVGDELFLSTTGGLSAIEPDANNESQFIGTVLKAATAGEMLVNVQKSVNYDSAIASANTILDLQNNMSKLVVTVSGAYLPSLSASSVEIIPPKATEYTQIHSASLIMEVVPATSGTQAINFGLMTGTASGAAYDPNMELMETGAMTSTQAVTSGANALYQMFRKEIEPINHLTVGDGVYLTNSDIGSQSEWGGVTQLKIVVFYTQYRLI